MKLTSQRVSRYLSMQKKVNDYLLKLSAKDREALIQLSGVRYQGLLAENGLRNLLEYSKPLIKFCNS